MSEQKLIQLQKIAKEFNVGFHVLVEKLHQKGHLEVENKLNVKITPELAAILYAEPEFQKDRAQKQEADKVVLSHSRKHDNEIDFPIASPKLDIKQPTAEPTQEDTPAASLATSTPNEAATKPPIQTPEAVIKVATIDTSSVNKKVKEEIATADMTTATEEPAKKSTAKKIISEPKLDTAILEKKTEKIENKKVSLDGPTVVDKIDLDADKKKTKSVATGGKKKVDAPLIKTTPVVLKKPEAVAPDPQPTKTVAPTPTIIKEKELPQQAELIERKSVILAGVTSTGEKIDLSKFNESNNANNSQGGRKRIVKDTKRVDIAAETKKQINKEEFRRPDTANQPRAFVSQPGTNTGYNRPAGQGNYNNNNRPAVGGGNNRPGGGGGGGASNYRGGGGGGNRSGGGGNRPTGNRGATRPQNNEVISEEEIQNKIRETMAKLAGGSLGGKTKYRPKSKQSGQDENEDEITNVIELTEFITVSELASIMDVQPTAIITSCFKLGVIVSINQRIDAEIIELVSSEFGFEVKFISLEEQEDREAEDVEWDTVETLKDRAPIVTIMGHVDHGKTSLLDFIRSANVVAGEMGGITQHIGAYEVTLPTGKQITFLDTPGHEAFTAMRARGAKLTDIAVIVVSADDAIMPQTKEAISHAQAASVPIIFAINKIDKDGANPEKIKEQLASMNLLVEDWGGKIQSQDISAKKGLNIDKLLEKILLEAELLELKANPERPAIGSVIEASLDKGRGYVANIMVQTGTLKQGDMMVAGSFFGRVKAMSNERGTRVDTAGPSTPVMVLGLMGAPQAGDKFKVYVNESEAKEVATKRQQLQREQGLRAQKHITLEEIGRRLALGNFKELRLIVKGDVDGSVEALSDSLIRLSTESIQIIVINKAVGQISETDVMLATASDAIIIGFNVRPSIQARKTAEKEAIEIRSYGIIYDAIEDVKSAMEGLMEPKIEEKIVCQIEVREVFKIPKVGTIAGCYVQEGKVARNTRVRVVRDGIVLHTGELASLKRFKDDVKEVNVQTECGLNIKNFNDVAIGDTIEGFEEIQVKVKL